MKKLRTKKQSGFTLIEIVLVLLIIGVMSAIAVPNFLKRLRSQRIEAGANQILTHLRQIRQRAIKDREFYRANFEKFENAYILEKCSFNSATDSVWKSIQVFGQEKEEEVKTREGSTETETERVIFLPKDIRVSDESTMKILYTPKGNLDPGSLPAEIFVISQADKNKKITLDVNLSGIPKIVSKER